MRDQWRTEVEAAESQQIMEAVQKFREVGLFDGEVTRYNVTKYALRLLIQLAGKLESK